MGNKAKNFLAILCLIFVVSACNDEEIDDQVKNDKTAPKITVIRDYFEILVGQPDLDYASGAFAYDAVDGEVPISIEGKWDNKKIGVYPLKYVAQDRAKNKATADFTLAVVKKYSTTYDSNDDFDKNSEFVMNVERNKTKKTKKQENKEENDLQRACNAKIVCPSYPGKAEPDDIRLPCKMVMPLERAQWESAIYRSYTEPDRDWWRSVSDQILARCPEYKGGVNGLFCGSIRTNDGTKFGWAANCRATDEKILKQFPVEKIMKNYVYHEDDFIQDNPECKTIILKQLLERQQQYRKK
ncbi:MAG: hypothetical protein CR975_03265 [Gammaproteobacteria bacterium]|nr:MAG: hypothetical protein CR975_03265 [Gammaproteobacteria bacterium]